MTSDAFDQDVKTSTPHVKDQLEYQQLWDLVTSMDINFEELRTDARRRYDLYRMEKDPYVPDEIAREGKVRMLSPLVMYAAQTIRADLMMNPTEYSVIPLARERDNAISKRSETQAETLEKSLAVLWGRLNEGRRLDREVIWHQLVSPFAILMLEFKPLILPEQPNDMDDETYVELCNSVQNDWIPWHIFIPDPLTCSWVERDGAPVMFARRYRLSIRDLEDSYANNPSSMHPDKKLIFEEDRFKWVSDDYRRDMSTYRLGFREVECVWLDDGVNIYQAVTNPGGDGGGGQLLAVTPNPAGRCTAFVVPGNTTPERAPHKRYEPFLLPLMQAVNQINDIRSMRATAARNLAGPHTYVAIDPEITKLYMTRGEKLPTAVRWRKGETHYLLGEIKTLPSEVSEDWDKVEVQVNEEMQRYLPSPFVNVIDPAVLKAATATSILHAAEAGMRMYGPLMAAYDAAMRDICEAIIYSIKFYYKEDTIYLHATGDEVAGGKNLTKGSIYRLNAKALNFDYKIIVRTRGMSRAQASAQYEAVLNQWILPDGTKGPATMDDLIDAANYSDSTTQKMKLAKEEILRSIDPWIQEMAITGAAQQIQLDTGIVLPIGQQLGTGGVVPAGGDAASSSAPTGPGTASPTPAAMPNNAQHMSAPLVGGPSGGSAPNEVRGNS